MWRQKVIDIAKDYPDVTFAIADEDDMSDLFKGFGFEESGEEINIGILGEKDAKYPMPPMEEFDSDEIREFVDNFKNGKSDSFLLVQMVFFFFILAYKYLGSYK